MVWQYLQPARQVSELVMTSLMSAAQATSSFLDHECTFNARWLADAAVRALIDEADLTPKPALVDARGPGAHRDMSLELLHRSALSLRPTFEAIAIRAFHGEEGIALREELSALGRDGEETMLGVTGGVNTHRGAIWTLGLLCAAASLLTRDLNSADQICAQAGRLARLPDSYFSLVETHGAKVARSFNVRGARGEAENGLPHIVGFGLPALKKSRLAGLQEGKACLNALIAMMAELDDTCLLHRGGAQALTTAKQGARRILEMGGVATENGFQALEELDRNLLLRGASPGGSADLLAGTLFLDSVERNFHSRVGGALGAIRNFGI
jgi:triphosphoribosyl-dephospho-CoA synthase